MKTYLDAEDDEDLEDEWYFYNEGDYEDVLKTLKMMKTWKMSGTSTRKAIMKTFSENNIH